MELLCKWCRYRVIDVNKARSGFETMNDGSKRRVRLGPLVAGVVMLFALAAGIASFPLVVSAEDESLCDAVEGATLEALIEAEVCHPVGAPVIESVSSNASGEVGVTWTPGYNAAGNLVILFMVDLWEDYVVASKGAADTTHTFTDVAAGEYLLVVVSYDAEVELQYVFEEVSVPAN